MLFMSGPTTTDLPRLQARCSSSGKRAAGGAFVVWRSDMPKVKLICEKCGREFEVFPYYAKRGQRFCSVKCHNDIIRKKVSLRCAECGRSFMRVPVDDGGERVFCSRQCANAHNGRGARGPDNHRYIPAIETRCAYCGKLVVRSRSQMQRSTHHYCNVKCRSAALASRRAHTTAAQRKAANYLAQARITDMSQCELCGSTEDLMRHHEDYNRPLDVMILCRTCHMRLHAHILEVGSACVDEDGDLVAQEAQE